MPLQNEDDLSEDSSSEGSFSDLDHEPRTTKKKSAITFHEKDSDEEELERLVLGNSAGFRENLFKADTYADGKEVQLAGDESGELEDVQDSDLFMFDTGAGNSSSKATAQTTTTKDPTASGDAPAWEDSDDERLAVSLVAATRLRKLRLTEAEDIVSGTEYTRRLRQQFLRLNPQPTWANQSEDRPAKRRRRSSAGSDSSASDSDDEMDAKPLEKFLRSVNKLGGYGNTVHKRVLRPEVINIQRTREIPDQHKAPVSNLSFHPEYPVLLSSSGAGVLFLHHIAPEAQPTPNPQLTSVQIKKVDVKRAEFLYPQGDKIFFAGRRRYFHQWDLPSGVVQRTTQIQGHKKEHRTMEKFKLSPCGRYMGIVSSDMKGSGSVSILSTTSTQWIATARLTSTHGIADFAWWSTGDGLSILGRDGQVGEYSMESKTFIGIWNDEGCVGGTKIALGGHNGPHALGDDRWVAVGSTTGIVNIYDRLELHVPGEKQLTLKERPTPQRVFEQIVTSITEIVFSPDGQLLAFASRHTKDALKLVHLPSCTVFRNWPTAQTPLGRVRAIAFPTKSDILAVGNDVGKVRLWEIRD